jgi:hypothetical protein
MFALAKINRLNKAEADIVFGVRMVIEILMQSNATTDLWHIISKRMPR